MDECVDGEYQDFKAKDGAYVREHFFGKYPETAGDGRRLVGRRHLAPESRRPRSVQGLRRLSRRGRSTRASRRSSSPRPSKATAWATAGEGENDRRIRPKKMVLEELKHFRDRFDIPVSDERTDRSCRYPLPAEDQPEDELSAERAQALGGYLPARAASREPLRDSAAVGLRTAAARARKVAKFRPPWRSCGC